MAVKSKTAARSRRHTRLRKKIVGTELRPRLVVTRSARHVFVQVVDDSKGRTVASASTMESMPEPSSTSMASTHSSSPPVIESSKLEQAGQASGHASGSTSSPQRRQVPRTGIWRIASLAPSSGVPIETSSKPNARADGAA